jgi:hypothetical protein
MAHVQDIISQITKAGGLSRPNRYSVQIVPPDISAALNGVTQQIGNVPDYFSIMGVTEGYVPTRLNFMCCNAELPEKRFGASSVRTYGSHFQMPYIDFYANITLKFICGLDMFERKFFDAWSYLVQDPETSDFNYVADYSTTMDIFQLTEYNDQATYGIRFFQCWPIAIGAMELSYENFNTYHKLPVTFEYRRWTNLQINMSSPTLIETGNSGPSTFNNTIINKP